MHLSSRDRMTSQSLIFKKEQQVINAKNICIINPFNKFYVYWNLS